MPPDRPVKIRISASVPVGMFQPSGSVNRLITQVVNMK